MKYGYARVSTDGQSVDAQVRQLTRAGCKKVFREVASGAKTDRLQLRRLLLDQLTTGDVLMVTRLDRLARSTRDLLNPLAPRDHASGDRCQGATIQLFRLAQLVVAARCLFRLGLFLRFRHTFGL